MSEHALLEWEGKEYDHQPKSANWYWVLGIITLALAVAAALFSDYLFTALIAIAGVVLAVHAAKEPPTHQFRLTENGLVIGNDLHAFGHMRSFSVLTDAAGEAPPLLSIKTDSWLTPHLVLPLEGVDETQVYAYFLAHVKEDEHRPTFTDVVASLLGF